LANDEIDCIMIRPCSKTHHDTTMSELVSKGYVTLCTAVQESGESLSVVVRIGRSISSNSNVEAIELIRGILTFSPAPDSMAIEFLNELAKVSGMEYLGE
jgi:hypothetical protein